MTMRSTACGPIRPAGHEGSGGFTRGEGSDFIEPVMIEDLGEQPHASAAALAEIGTQGEPIEGRRRCIS